MAKNPSRIPEENAFVTRELLSKEVTTLTIAKVIQRDRWHATTSQQACYN